MDLPPTDVPGVPLSDAVSSAVGDKRPIENGNAGETVVPPAKKLRLGEDMKRVAEIVLVLAAMGRMRGGKTPTETELELMTEARAKLAEMCQEFTPKDIIGSDAVGAVIEDLGLNGKLKDQRLGFRAPKLTISEKLSLSKRKMEESKKYPAPSTGYTSQFLQPSGVPGAPSHSTLVSGTHMVRTLAADRASHQSVSSGVFPTSSSYGAVAGNVSMAHQWHSNDVKASTISATTVGSHYIRDASGLAQSRMERPQIKSDMLTSASLGPAISSANYALGNASTWSAQPHSTIQANSDNKAHVQSSARVSEQNYRSFVSQTPPGVFPGTNQLIQGMSYGQASPFGNNHVEIAKIVQKFLQPRVHQNPTWNPPSREYMNKAMACQICQANSNDIETILICDACDKGYHLRCLQTNNLKGVPKSEWHCTTCVQLYHGKPFPPKYGRVMRSANTPKVPSNTAGAQLASEKKDRMPDLKVNQQNTIVTASPALQSSPGFDSGRSKPPATVSHSETASLNSNASAKAATNASIGLQGHGENVTGSHSPSVPVSDSKAANATATATPSAMMNNGFVSEGPKPVGTSGCTSELPLEDCVPANEASDAAAGAAVNFSPEAQVPAVVGTSVINSQASGTGNETSSKVDSSLSTQGQKVIDTLDNNFQAAVSCPDAANATADAAISAMVNASSGSQGPVGNGVACGNSSELISHAETLNTEGTTENSQGVTERTGSVISEKGVKLTVKSSMLQENLICQTEEPVAQPPALSSNSYHSLPENKTSNVESALQNNAEYPCEEESIDVSDGN